MGFVAYEVSLEMVKSVAPVIHAVARRDRALADQMRRAASSVPLNVAEGSRRQGKDRKHCYRIAAGSAHELRTAIRVAESCATSMLNRLRPRMPCSTASSRCSGA